MEKALVIWLEDISQKKYQQKEMPYGIFQKLAKIIKYGVYSPNQVWNADESGLFWKRIPSRTYVEKKKKTAGGWF